MNEIWYEEELLQNDDDDAGMWREIASQTNENEKQIRGNIRVHRPRWDMISIKDDKILSSGVDFKFLLIKLGFEFEVLNKNSKASFTFARCEAFVRSTEAANCPQPKVYEIIPKDIYDGEPQKVSLKIGPQISIGEFGGALGDISSDITIGRITPSVVGWKGKDEQSPYWELRPVKKQLLGIQNFWTIIEVPEICKSIRVSVRVEGEIQSHLGLWAIGPKSRSWDSRPGIKIDL